MLRSTLILLVLSFVFATTLNAQCPSGSWDGPFARSFVVTNLDCNPGQPVTVTVTYCIPGPYIFPSFQYFIAQIDVNPACLPMDGDVIRKVGKALIEENPHDWPCTPKCPAGGPEYRVTWHVCGKDIDQGIKSQWVPCDTDTTAGCIDLYQTCCDCGPDDSCGTADDVGMRATLIGTNPTQEACGLVDPECEVSCPGPPSKIVPHTDPSDGHIPKEAPDLSYDEQYIRLNEEENN